MIRVAVTGAKGRMGSTVVQAVTDAPDMEVVALLDAGDAITAQSVNGAQVAVDFSVPTVTESNVHALIDAGVDVVVGTTGWTEESYARVSEHACRAGQAVLIAPNFAMGAVLAMKFAAMAAPYFESAEVIEMHHPGKVDAPSGTAVATACGMAQARRAAGWGDMPDATQTDELGARGGRVDGIPVHAVRLRGLTASEEILLGNEGEQLVIRTDSFDRASFMPGVLLGVRRVIGRTGLTIGLDEVMDL